MTITTTTTTTTTAAIQQQKLLRYVFFLSLVLCVRLDLPSMVFPFVGATSGFVTTTATPIIPQDQKKQDQVDVAMDSPFFQEEEEEEASTTSTTAKNEKDESLDLVHPSSMTKKKKSSIHHPESDDTTHNHHQQPSSSSSSSQPRLHHHHHHQSKPKEEQSSYNNLNHNNSTTWPWPHHKNKTTSPPPTTTPQPQPQPIDASCAARSTCHECNSLTCHWCTFDNQCHAKGSPYGCAVGSNCLPPRNHTDDDDDDHTDDDDPADKSCRSHKSCTDCVLSSTLCHWCAFDDQCHAIGSWYGCVHGTDCYSNDRCQRKSSEKLVRTSFVSDIGFVPVVLILSVAVCVVFCATVVYSGARALKGAYEELAEVGRTTMMTRSSSSMVRNEQTVALLGNEMMEGEEEEEDNPDDDGCVDGIQDDAGGCGDGDGDETEQSKHPIGTEIVPNNNNSNNNNTTTTDTESLLQETPIPPPTTTTTAQQQPDDTHYTQTTTTRGSSSSIIHSSSSNLVCLTKVCQAWYIVTILSTILIGALTLYCFPRMPQYNLCADEIAWKSIISGLTSLKMEASFELLVSIENRNHLGIVMESFGGIMNHDGGEVGSFLVPDSILPASSITDVLVTCTVTPKKWETLGLIAEYYKGTLILSMSVNGAVKITGIDYSFPVKETNIVVKVNDPSLDDRHLCACPEWKDLSPSAAPIPEFLSGGKYGTSTWTIV